MGGAAIEVGGLNCAASPLVSDRGREQPARPRASTTPITTSALILYKEVSFLINSLLKQ
jgi:hypothetical protein